MGLRLLDAVAEQVTEGWAEALLPWLSVRPTWHSV